MFFYENKRKVLILSLIASSILFFTGCNNEQSNQEKSPSNINILSIKEEVEHKSFIENPIDINNLDDSIIKSTVNRVVDGDTVELIFPNDEIVDTRLLLIDTPETKHPKLGVQKYGLEASEFAKNVLQKGDIVYFQLDGKIKTDKYKRYLGYLWYNCDTHNKLELYNERVIEEGLARVGYVYNQRMYLKPLLEAQEVAKTKKINIWSIQNYVTDKGYDMTIYADN
ncbi:MAG: thermonuclease family protein [Peptostreptococcaceae bacterium]